MFPQTYEESRARFREQLDRVRWLWPNARLLKHAVGGDESLTIDWIEADALADKSKLLIFTTGEHGIEGYVGSAMLQIFIEEYLARLDPHVTGLLIVHAINPWGMKHRRRTNAANVDLNRTFLPRVQSFDPSFNPELTRLTPLLLPQGPIRSLFLSSLVFAIRLAWSLFALGPRPLRHATLLGQYRFPQGVYYGGTTWPEETRTLMDLYRAHMGQYDHIVHLDMHTGYGPRYQMSLVNSWMEPKDSLQLAREFAYPLVVKSNPSEFYSIQGDMIDLVYTLVKDGFPGKRLYATSFEFGTYGDSTLAILRGLRAKILENQLYWYDAASPNIRRCVERDFGELYFPTESRWREKAMADARQAFEGILRVEGFAS